LTAKGDATDRVVGLELGADDYLGKPFEPRELLARVHAVSRRGLQPAPGHEIKVNEVRLAPLSRSAYLSGELLKLTSVEYDLLLALAKSAGKVLSRDELAHEIGRQLLPFDRTIDMHILNLRRKIRGQNGSGPEILTVRGSGYMLPIKDATA
jgi:two-component system response regulator CpxR